MGSEWRQPNSDLLPGDGLLMTVSRWLPDGSPCPLTTVKDGNGVVVAYHENGQIRSKGSYKDGKQDGPWEFYDDNGQLIEKYSYKNGQVLKKSSYKDYGKDGLWEEYDDNGQLKSKISYLNHVSMQKAWMNFSKF